VSDSEDDDSPQIVLLTRLGELTAAQLLCGRLAADGIESFLPDEHLAAQNWHLQGAIGGIRVQVRRADLARAKEILAQPLLDVDEGPGASQEADDGNISLGDRAAFRALRVALVTLLLPGIVHPYSLWLAARALGRPDITAWGRWRALVALAVSSAGCACLGYLVYQIVR